MHARSQSPSLQPICDVFGSVLCSGVILADPSHVHMQLSCTASPVCDVLGSVTEQ